jgi:hypothetical protein
MVPYLAQHGIHIVKSLGTEKYPAETDEMKGENTSQHAPE